MPIFAALFFLTVQAPLPADIAAGLPAPGCPSGWCRTGVRTGPPSGLMFLAVGLVGGGVAGWWSRRKTG